MDVRANKGIKSDQVEKKSRILALVICEQSWWKIDGH